ncbi:MAG: DUF1343 domain-containing protein [Chlamydiota bacterium]
MRLFLFIILFTRILNAAVDLGVDRFFAEGFDVELKGKRIGIVTNQTGVNKELRSTIDLFVEHAGPYTITAFFSPEHGIDGSAYAWEKVEESKGPHGILVHNLMGDTRRPTEEMLKEIDVLIYDIQDIGIRPYTYATTLFYVMEEAAKKKIQVIILDRPNPMGGFLVDGPMLEDKWRSFIGYINVPYCHGMTIGELALFFNQEYGVKCSLKVIAMKGWERSMTFKDTGLTWVPTSPHIPEADTPFYCASTGLLGELGLVNIGIGYTLPFKLVGAPWINAKEFAEALNAQKLSGVRFLPFHYRPFFGSQRGNNCQGIKIVITNPATYRPLMIQYLILGVLKTLYPKQFEEALAKITSSQKELFCKASGNAAMLDWIEKEKYIAWKLIQYQHNDKEAYLVKRKQYLLY